MLNVTDEHLYSVCFCAFYLLTDCTRLPSDCNLVFYNLRLKTNTSSLHCYQAISTELLIWIPDRPWVPPSLLYNGYRVSFPDSKWPGHGVNPPPPSRAEVKERLDLYPYFPFRPSWPVIRRTLPLPFFTLWSGITKNWVPTSARLPNILRRTSEILPHFLQTKAETESCNHSKVMQSLQIHHS